MHSNKLARAAIVIGALGCGSDHADHSGTVFLTQLTGSGTTSYTVSAEFVDIPLDVLVSGEISGCTVTIDGACRAARCSGPSQLTLSSAGTLSVSVDGSELASVAMPSAGPYSASQSFAAFAAGDGVQFAASGASVPEFTVSVPAPEAPTVTLPTTIALATDLVVTWDASIAAEQLRFSVVATAGTGPIVVSCVASAADGSLTVPAAIVDGLGAGSVSIGLLAQNSSTIRAGAFDVQAQVAHGITGLARVE